MDIILEGDCSCCKEIYYKASALDPGIGTATVYRMVNALEQIGAISRRNMYRISGDGDDRENACRVELSDHTVRIFLGRRLDGCGEGRTERAGVYRRSGCGKRGADRPGS